MSELDGAAESGDLDFDLDASFDEAPAETTGQAEGQETSQGGTSKQNPAWAPLLEKIPSSMHPIVEPVLREWDQGVQKRFQTQAEQFAPYRPLLEQKIDPQDLMGAYGLVQQMNENPLDFFERYKQMLISQGLYQEAAQVQQVQDEAAAEESAAEFRDPRVDQLQAQQQQFLESVQQAQAQAAIQESEQRNLAAIASELDSLKQRYGNFPDWVEAELYDRAARLTNELGRPASLTEAMADFQQMRQNILSVPRPGAQAPKVVPGGGGYPQAQVNREALKTEGGRLTGIQAIIARTRGD